MVPMKVIWKKLQANDLKEFCKINIKQIQQFTFRDIYLYIHIYMYVYSYK